MSKQLSGLFTPDGGQYVTLTDGNNNLVTTFLSSTGNTKPLGSGKYAPDGSYYVTITDGNGNIIYNPPSWTFPGVNVDADLANSRYWVDGTGTVTVSSLLNITRNSTSYASDLSGNLVSFGTNVLRQTNKGLLIEGATTNIQPYSLFQTGGIWTTAGANANFASNIGLSPDNTMNAAHFYEDTTANANHEAYGGFSSNTALANTTYTASFYVARAPGSPRDIIIALADAGTSTTTFWYFSLTSGRAFCLSNGSKIVNVACYSEAVSNGFWRLIMTFTTATGVTALNQPSFFLTPADNPGVLFGGGYTGDGASGLYLFGAQIESGKSVSSLITTTATAVTRPSDNITISGAAKASINSTSGTALVLTTGGEGAGIAADILNSNGTTLLGFTSSDTLTSGITSSLTTTNTANRILANERSAISWNASGRSLILGAGTSVTDSVAQIPSATIYLGSNAGTSSSLNGYVQRFSLWNTKQTNPQNNFSLIQGTNFNGIGVAGPGTANWTSFNWPSSSDWSYFSAKGIRSIRLGISWENAQPTLAAPIDPSYLSFLKSALASAAAIGATVIVDLHNYAHYVSQALWLTGNYGSGNGGTSASGVYAIGDGNLPISDFVDFWTRMATALVGSPGLGGYGLMNEPYNLASTATWPSAVQQAYTAIRAVDANGLIYIPGDGTNSVAVSGAFGYVATQYYPTIISGTGIVYEAHQYPDGPEAVGGGGTFSGTYTSYGIDNYSAIRCVQGYVGFLKRNNYTGFLGEYGVPNDTNDNDAQWLVLNQKLEAYLVQQGVQNSMFFYGAQNAGAGANIQFNPQAGVDDTRLVNMIGYF